MILKQLLTFQCNEIKLLTAVGFNKDLKMSGVVKDAARTFGSQEGLRKCKMGTKADISVGLDELGPTRGTRFIASIKGLLLAILNFKYQGREIGAI